MEHSELRTAPLGTRLLVTVTVFLLLLSLITAWAYSRQEEYRQRQLLLISDARLQLGDLRERLLEARSRTGVDVSTLSSLADQMRATTGTMAEDDPVLTLLPSPLQEPTADLQDALERLLQRIDQIREAGGSRQAFSGQINLLIAAIPRLQQVSNDVVESLVDNRARRDQVASAQQQAWYAEKMRLEAVLLRQDAQRSDTYVNGLHDAMKQYEYVLEAMWAGDHAAKVRRVEDAESRRLLADTRDVFLGVKQLVQQLQQMHTDLQEALQAGEDATELAIEVAGAIEALRSDALTMGGRAGFRPWHGLLLFAVTLVFIVLSLRRLVYTSAHSVSEDRLNALAGVFLERSSGSTQPLEVTDPRLRGLVVGANSLLEQRRAEQATLQDRAKHLQQRAADIERVAVHVDGIRQSAGEHVQPLQVAVDDLRKLLQREAAVSGQAQDTVEIAHAGWEVLQRLNGMLDTVADTLQDARARVQQDIAATDIVRDALQGINDIAGQTRLLAMNATLLANRAGEAGRGFGAVADDIQSLAERVGDAATAVSRQLENQRAGAEEVDTVLDEGSASLSSAVRLARDAGTSIVQLEKSGKGLAETAPDIRQDAEVLQQSAAAWHADYAELEHSLESLKRTAMQLQQEAAAIVQAGESVDGQHG